MERLCYLTGWGILRTECAKISFKIFKKALKILGWICEHREKYTCKTIKETKKLSPKDY